MCGEMNSPDLAVSPALFSLIFTHNICLFLYTVYAYLNT